MTSDTQAIGKLFNRLDGRLESKIQKDSLMGVFLNDKRIRNIAMWI